MSYTKIKPILAIFIAFVLLLGYLPHNVSFANTSGMIKRIYTDKAKYNPGESIAIKVEMTNDSGSTFSDNVNLTIHHLETQVHSTSQAISLANGDSTTVTLNWTAPSTDFRGYFVKVTAGSSVGVTAIDVSSDWTRFPRYGYITEYPDESSAVTDARVKRTIEDYHTNAFQLYDWMWRHENNIKRTNGVIDSSWTDWSGNHTMYWQTIQNLISSMHNYNAAAMPYTMNYATLHNYESISGVSPEWAMYNDTGHQSQLGFDFDDGDPDTWLWLFNPASAGWQNHIYGQYRDIISTAGFDGIHLDQMGERSDPYDYNGNVIDLDNEFSGFVNNLRTNLDSNGMSDKVLTFNSVDGAADGWAFEDVTKNSEYDFTYTEIWGNADEYSELKALIDKAKHNNNQKAVVLAAYMNFEENTGTLYEAESATLNGVSTNNNHLGYTGSGFVDGFGETGDYVQFSITVPEEGWYGLVFRYANDTGTKNSRSLYVDGTFTSQIKNFLDQENWETWKFDASDTVWLTAGTHTVKLVKESNDTGFINLDSLTLGTFDEASVRLTGAAIAAAGASRIEMGEGDQMLGHPYFPNRAKQMRNSLKAATINQYNFITAYENLLFDKDVFNSDSGNQFVEITDQPVVGYGQPGNIWQMMKRNDNYNIVHLINLKNSTDTDWRNSDNTPTTLTNLATKVYIGNEESISNVYVASPDVNLGATQELTFTMGSDSRGKYVSFTLPTLQYWDMIYMKRTFTQPTNDIFQAEDGVKVGVGVNTNHVGYTGTGFLDNFVADTGVTMTVNATQGVDQVLRFRYANGTADPATRDIIVDGNYVGYINFEPTGSWDAWSTAEFKTQMKPGKHTITMWNNPSNVGAINLDNLDFDQLYVSALGDVTGTLVSGDTLTLTVDNGALPNDDKLIFDVLQSDIVKVSYRPNDIAPSPDTPMIDPNKTWSLVGATIDTLTDPITITTSKMKVEIAKTPARVTIKKADGTTLMWEPSSGGIFNDGIRFLHKSRDNIYGIGSTNANEAATNIIRNTSREPAHAGHQGDGGGPLMWSTSGYGILVDSDGGYPYTHDATGKLEFTYGSTPIEGRRYNKDDVEYYAIVGNPKEIMSGVADITGKSPLLPKWSLGFMNFEWGTDQAETLNNIDTYRAKNIPIDTYALDYDWKKYGEDNYGEFAWNTTKFPDAGPTLKSTMDSKGIKMIGITKPRIVTQLGDGTRTVQYNDANAGGYWYPGHSEYQDYFVPVMVRSIDPYNANARAWYWDHSKDAFDKGLVGWWNDETDKVSSGSAQFWFGNFSTSHLSQAMYEGQRTYTNNSKRVWQTARTFYPGAQRYATTFWSGDIGTHFYKNDRVDWASGMKDQRTVMLSSINLGQPKWGMDSGGFAPSDFNPTPELYGRWLQFSALTPVFRVHGNYNHQRQPWYYGTTAEEAAKSAMHLRYSLIPYMYTYERSAFENGLGLVKPLIFDYPSDPAVKNYSDAWMFGDWLLAAPVVDKKQTSKDIYLPAGTWTDYFRGITYTGGQTIQYPVNAETLSDIPLFIKKGAIIPSQKVQDYIGQSSIDHVNVDVFPDTAQTSFTYYDDDGASYNYESGTHFKQLMTSQDNGTNGISFNIGAKLGTYTPSVQSYIVKIHGKAGSGVTSSGTSLTSYADLNALKAATGEGWATGKDVYGNVTYVKITAASSSDKNIVVTGSSTVSGTSVKFEAEDASLSGNTTSTKAKVNTNHTGYSGTGFVDGFDQAGAAVTFYADVKTGGDYSIALRYANATGSAKTVSIFVNGARVKNTSLGNLANWDTWAVQNETVPLSAGRNAITYKYYSDAGDTGNVNLDYITVPFDPSVGKYETESASLSGGAKNNLDKKYYSGNSFVDGITTVGAEAKFSVNVPTSGDYQVALRYANGSGSTKTLSTYINGIDVVQASLTSPGSNWDVWQDHVQTLSLSAGTNTIAYKYDSDDSGNVNLDRILVSSGTPGIPESEKNLLDNPGFDRDINYISNWTEWHPSTQSLAYGIDSGTDIHPPQPPWTGDKRAYFYLASAYQQSIHQLINVPNATYKFEAWVKMSETTPTTARAEISNYGDSAIFHNITIGGGWKYISISNINVTNGQIDVGFYVDSPGGTILHIDDVRITKQ